VVTVQLTAHITIDGVLRLPGTTILVTTRLAANLIASGYARTVPGSPDPDIVFASQVIVLNPIEAVPGELPAGTVILRRPT
jgi:hypothetical protein